MNKRIRELIKPHLVRSEYTEFGWQECHRYEFDEDEIKEFVESIQTDAMRCLRDMFEENSTNWLILNAIIGTEFKE